MGQSMRLIKSHTLVYVLLIVMAFFVSKWTIDGAYFRKDLVINTVPIENLYGQIQRSGQSPLWAPELAGGYPLLAIAQLGYWYPPHMLLRQFFSGVWTLNLSLLLHAMLAAAGTFAWLRYNKVRSLAAGAAALLFPLGATFVGKYESLNLILPFMWVPVLLWCLQLFMEYGKPIYLALWIGVNVWCVLIGHPQMALYVLILEAIFVVCLTGLQLNRWRRALVTVVGVGLVLGLTSFYWLPIVDNLSDTDRSAGTLHANAAGMFDYEFTPTAFLGVVVPHPFGHHDTYHGPTNENELSAYFGPVALLLAALGMWLGRKKFPVVWWLAVALAVVGLSLAVGGYSPIFTWMVAHGWTYFNAPARFFFYTDIGLVWFMALGLDAVLDYMNIWPWKQVVTGLVLVAAVLPVLWVSWTWNDGVPWKLTAEPAVATWLRQQPGWVRIFSGKTIAGIAGDNDFGIKTWNPICAKCLYKQTFVSPFPTMNGVSVKMSALGIGSGTVTVHLYTQGGQQIRQASLLTRDIVDSDWNTFHWQTINPTVNQQFYIELTSTLDSKQAPHLLIHTNPTEQYDPTGQLYNCTSGQCTAVHNADAAFVVTTDSPAVSYYEALAPYVSAGFGIGTMQWAGSLPLANVKDYLQPLGTWGDPWQAGARTIINRFATTYLIALFPPYRYATDTQGVTLMTSMPMGDQFLRVYRNDQAWPRLQFVSTVKSIPDSLDQFNTLLRLHASEQKTVVADVTGGDKVFDPADNAAQIVSDKPTQVVIQTQQAADGFLVLRDVLLKGWVATVDNQPVHVYLVDGLFRGVMVPTGNHTVVFRYQPTWIVTADYVEGVAVGLLALLLGLAFYRDRRR